MKGFELLTQGYAVNQMRGKKKTILYFIVYRTFSTSSNIKIIELMSYENIFQKYQIKHMIDHINRFTSTNLKLFIFRGKYLVYKVEDNCINTVLDKNYFHSLDFVYINMIDQGAWQGRSALRECMSVCSVFSEIFMQ